MTKYVPLTNQNFIEPLKKIRDFKGLHQGKNIFIMASGTSLSLLDLSKLEHRMVMGLNRSVLVHPAPYYHCTMDHRLFEMYPELLNNVRQLFTLEGRPWGLPLKLLGGEGFSFDLEEGIYSGYTISYLALQVAVYMGFKKIFFLGLDLRHDAERTHFFGTDHQTQNHERTEFPRMNKMLNHGAEVLASTDVKVYNCSPISTLECFPKISYEEALAS